jgi:hypothetical protein
MSLDNNKYTCISDYLIDPDSPLEDWQPLFKMASMGLAEMVLEDGEMSMWASEEQMRIFVELDVEDIIRGE